MRTGPHEEFSRRLQKARLAYAFDRVEEQLSYRELGKMVSEEVRRPEAFHEGTVRAWFHGSRPDSEIVLALAIILGVRYDWLAEKVDQGSPVLKRPDAGRVPKGMEELGGPRKGGSRAR